MLVAVASLNDLRRHRGPWPKFDMLELRLDLDEAWIEFLARPDDLMDSARAPGKPVIATCRRKQDGGDFAADEPQRLRVLAIGAQLADFVDIELGVSADAPAEKTIRSYHNLAAIPDDLATLVHSLRRAGGHYIKLVCAATSLCDNLRLRDLLKTERKREDLAAFCMGEYGVPSRILCMAWGSTLTYGSLSDWPRAAGMLPVRELSDVYSAPDIERKTPVYGVTGLHVSHSLSPRIHNAALRRSGIHAAYVPLPARDIADFAQFARSLPLRGVSVTVPFKEQVVDHCVALDETATALRAVNTLKLDDQRSMRGSNTDSAGFIAALEDEYGRVEAGCAFLVLGAGGSARAVVRGLLKAGAYVGVWARDFARAQKLCADIGGTPLRDLSGARWECVVNCTPCGMRGDQVDASPVDFAVLREHLHERAVFYDLVYEPPLTPLCARAQAEGLRVASGLGMLLRQAEAQAAIFGYLPANTRFAPPPAIPGDLVWLVGFRAAGKTTLAPLLAAELGVEAFDIDALVERRAGASVADLFARYGEAAFRTLEDVELSLLAARQRRGVVATGGGVVENTRLVEAMRSSGRVVWLELPEQEHVRRLQAQPGRPSLTGADAADEAIAVLRRRRPLYEQAAHLRVAADDRPPQALAGEIVARLAQLSR